MPGAAALIGVDWGTSRFRAYLFSAHGALLDSIDCPSGLLAVTEGAFGAVLRRECEAWFREHHGIAVLMCGMIGSRQGWREVPYIAGKIGSEELAAAAVSVEEEPNRIQIIPGLSALSFDGAPDVMRGEETMLVGALAVGSPQSALFCVPGTHSKWVAVRDSQIGCFSTYLTGELFALLKQRSVLTSLITSQQDRQAVLDDESFYQGLAMAADATSLLHRLFSIRARCVTESAPPYIVEDVLSGLLIGTELNAVSQQLEQHSGQVTLLSSGPITERYRKALVHMGHTPEVRDASLACRNGLCSVAEKLGHIAATDRVTVTQAAKADR